MLKLERTYLTPYNNIPQASRSTGISEPGLENLQEYITQALPDRAIRELTPFYEQKGIINDRDLRDIQKGRFPATKAGIKRIIDLFGTLGDDLEPLLIAAGINDKKIATFRKKNKI